MPKTYNVKVNNNFTFNITTADANNLDVISVTDTTKHILYKNKSVKAEIIATDFIQKEYTIKVNNNTYKVDIADTLDQLIKKMGFEMGATKQINIIKAPMPGLILEVSVTEGQEVQENDPLLILEAMKMENSIVSPRSGKIKTVTVIKGNTVEKGTLLIEFE